MSAAPDYARMFHQRAMEARKRINSAKPLPKPERVSVLIYNVPPPVVYARRAEVMNLYDFPIGPTRPDIHNLMLTGDTFTRPGTLYYARVVLSEVSRETGISAVDIMSQRRSPRVVQARHKVMWRLRHETEWSTPRIGKFLGDRDHTTILSGIRRHQARLDAGKAK